MSEDAHSLTHALELPPAVPACAANSENTVRVARARGAPENCMNRSSAQLVTMVELAPDAMLIVDTLGTVLYANQQLLTLFGCTRETLIDSSVDCLLPERFRARHEIHRQHFARNSLTRPMGAGRELCARRSNGSEFPVEISLHPLQDGLTAATIRDVTERKRIEHELVAARESAEQAREAADRANAAKSRFLATASHDLRQPLQALSLLNGTLRRLEVGADAAHAVAQQGQAIDAMKRLVNALLDISKLESGAIRPQPGDFRLSVLFDDLHGEFASAAAEKGLELRVEVSAQFAYADASLVEQVLRNLVANAIKYTRAGGVELRSLQRGGLVRIEVHDTGIGIPAESLPYIFDEFYQVDSAPGTARDGYGLGLSIVQRIVQLLGLRLDVQSEPGVGSTFALEVPLGHSNSDTSERSPAAERRIRPEPCRQRARVLVVEDDRGVLNATRTLLVAEGYQVATAASRMDALNTLRKERQIDLLITDYHLSAAETGLDVITSLRNALGRKIPVVLVTGDTSSRLNQLPQDEALRCVRKPIDPDEFLGIVRALLIADAGGAGH